MDSEATGEYVALAVRLQPVADGGWYLYVDGTHTFGPIPLVPATLVVRFWRVPDTAALRGTIRLEGTDHWAPIQSNTQLEELVRAWLAGGKHGSGSQE